MNVIVHLQFFPVLTRSTGRIRGGLLASLQNTAEDIAPKSMQLPPVQVANRRRCVPAHLNKGEQSSAHLNKGEQSSGYRLSLT
jgi:hypothetical protein